MSEYKVICYTREPEDDAVYAKKLADSMHIALFADGKIIELNHNSGVLFAKAVWNEDDTMTAKSLKNPCLFKMSDGSFGVTAIRVETDGSCDNSSRGCVLLFTSRDLIEYSPEVLIKLSDKYINDAHCYYDDSRNIYIIKWCDEDGAFFQTEISDMNIKPDIKYSPVRMEVPIAADLSHKAIRSEEFRGDVIYTGLKGALERNAVTVDERTASRQLCKLTVPTNTGIEMPTDITVSSREELDAVRVMAKYSDGTSSVKRIDWYADSVDFGKSGTYMAEGRVHQDHYEFPIALNRADPCIGKWKDKYYFIATNDADKEHTLYIREADSIRGLVTAQEVEILNSNMYDHIGNLLWAPEFHIIKDKLYIFHAATPLRFEDEQCHVMALREGGNPMKKEDWDMPKRVVRRDGSPLFEAGITLDMTCFEVEGRYYVCWSQRQFVPKDLGAWLYLAEINPDEPWRLLSEPVLISAPEFGWANNHTFVDEGPFVIMRNGKLYLTFSSAAVDSTYVVGLLTADVNSDILKPESWIKANHPLLTSRSVEGQYGTGHNSYVCDEDGIYWNVYHGRPGITAPRCSGIRRVHFDIDGCPVLDMTEDLDLAAEYTQVAVKVRVK